MTTASAAPPLPPDALPQQRLAAFFAGKRPAEVFRSVGSWMENKAAFGLGAALALVNAAGDTTPAIRQVTVQSAYWPAELSPLRVVFLSDLHTGSRPASLAGLRQVVQRINGLRPDLVLLGGDYINIAAKGEPDFVNPLNGVTLPPEAIARELKAIRSPLAAVLGNHDNDYGAARVRNALEAVGITVLENQTATLATARGPVTVAGVADQWTARPDLAKVKQELGDRPHLLVTHNPDGIKAADTKAAVNFAGHTHGNQIGGEAVLALARLPAVKALIDRPAVRSHMMKNDVLRLLLECIDTPPGLSTNRKGEATFVGVGLGTSGVPLRLGPGTQPEIALLTILGRKGAVPGSQSEEPTEDEAPAMSL